jgi:uncharacterized membrane protein
MRDKTTRPIGKVSRKYTFIILAVLSGLVGAIWVAIDTYTGKAIVVDQTGTTNEYVFAIQSMTIGLIVSLIFVLFLWIPISKGPIQDFITKLKQKIGIESLPSSKSVKQVQRKKVIKRKFSFLGQWIDPQYHGIQLPNKEQLLWLGLSGLFSGVNTLIYFILIKGMDLSVFLPASQFVVVYLLVGDLIIDKSLPCAVEIQSIIMIILGVILAGIDFTSGNGSFNVVNLLLVFLVLNTSAAIYVIFQKKAVQVKNTKGQSMDSTNVRFWTLIFMAAATILFSLPFMNKSSWLLFRTTFGRAFLPIAISMLLVYIARILYVRALSMGKMSIVNSLASISVIAGIPITLICSFIWPQFFSLPGGEYAWVIWLLRGIGVILVFTGIVALSISEVKIIIFAKVKGGQICDIAKIKSISGVERVSAVTGKYDLMITLRSRTIGRGYQPIVDQLAGMPCLSEIVSSSILKEWNA